ncbi:hypothetical protein GCM10020219_080460 [Nonomuraea dietziae]
MHIAIVASDKRRTHILAVARELGREHRVTIYSRRDGADLKARTKLSQGVTVETIDAGPAEDLSADQVAPFLPDVGAYLMSRWQQDRPDVIHAHSWTGGLAAVAGAKGLGVPVIQTFHHSFGTVQSAKTLKLEQVLGRRADAVVAGCGDEESELIRMGVPRNHIAVVPYGVDVERFRRQGAAAARAAPASGCCTSARSPSTGARPRWSAPSRPSPTPNWSWPEGRPPTGCPTTATPGAC